MILQTIKLTHYKNYSGTTMDLHPEINVLVGDNGMGKTNILDAVYYLCLGKSYFSGQDRYVMQEGAEFTRLEGHFASQESSSKVVVKLIPRKLKEVSVDGKKHDRLVDHIGKFSCVVIAPIDVQLMLDGSEQRRRYVNNTIIQYDKEYTQALVVYNRLLRQRNALLKQMAENRTFNADLLDSHTAPLLGPAQLIYQRRSEFAKQVTDLHQQYYGLISGEKEETTLTYKTQLDQGDLGDLIPAAQEKDRVLGRSTVGIHKDDLEMKMDGRVLKFYGSQGQLKSYVLAMKLAQYDILQRQTTTRPILLLDDIFDKLDSSRVAQLIEVVRRPSFGQVFITDTSLDRVPGLLDTAEVNYRRFTVDHGAVCV